MTSICINRTETLSHGTTRCGDVALIIAANANTHCRGVAFGGRYPTLRTKRLFTAKELAGVNSETSKPAMPNAAGIRAVPSQSVVVDTSRTDVLMMRSPVITLTHNGY